MKLLDPSSVTAKIRRATRPKSKWLGSATLGLSFLLSLPLAAQEPTQFIIKFKTPTGLSNGVAGALLAPSVLEAAPTDLRFRRRLTGINANVYTAGVALTEKQSQQVIKELQSDPSVEYIEPDIRLYSYAVPNDPLYADQWHYKSSTGGIFLPEAWDITTGSSSVYVAVIDSGYIQHPDLSGRLIGGYDMITNSTYSSDGDGRDSNPTDGGDGVTANECGNGNAASNSSWHGAHVGGTIGASSNNGVGVAGVDWKAKMVHVRTQGKCGGQMSDIIDAITYSAGLAVSGVPTNPYPAKVINMSLGGTGTCSAATQAAIDAAFAAGAVIVASAGNSNLNLDSNDITPAECNNVLNVAATGPTGGRAPYSNYGASVSIAAPGGDTSGASANGVYSTLDTGTSGQNSYTYSFYQGTSMASPHVSGVLSLMFAAYPDMTPTQAMTWIKETTTAHTSGTGNDCTTSTCGPGLLNAKAAVAKAYANAPKTNTLSVSASTDSGGGCVTRAFAAERGKETSDNTFGFSPVFWLLVVGLARALVRSRKFASKAKA